ADASVKVVGRGVSRRSYRSLPIRCWNSPLVRSAIADPRSVAAVEVQRGAVLQIGLPIRVVSGTHVGVVRGNEEITGVARCRCRGKAVGKLHSHRPAFLGQDYRAEIIIGKGR